MSIVVMFRECSWGFALTCLVLVIVAGIIVSAIGVSSGRGGGIIFGCLCFVSCKRLKAKLIWAAPTLSPAARLL